MAGMDGFAQGLLGGVQASRALLANKAQKIENNRLQAEEDLRMADEQAYRDLASDDYGQVLQTNSDPNVLQWMSQKVDDFTNWAKGGSGAPAAPAGAGAAPPAEGSGGGMPGGLGGGEITTTPVAPVAGATAAEGYNAQNSGLMGPTPMEPTTLENPGGSRSPSEPAATSAPSPASFDVVAHAKSPDFGKAMNSGYTNNPALLQRMFENRVKYQGLEKAQDWMRKTLDDSRKDAAASLMYASVMPPDKAAQVVNRALKQAMPDLANVEVGVQDGKLVMTGEDGQIQALGPNELQTYAMALGDPDKYASWLKQRFDMNMSEREQNFQESEAATDNARQDKLVGLQEQGLGLDRERLGIAQEGLAIEREGLGIRRAAAAAELEATKLKNAALMRKETRDEEQHALDMQNKRANLEETRLNIGKKYGDQTLEAMDVLGLGEADTADPEVQAKLGEVAGVVQRLIKESGMNGQEAGRYHQDMTSPVEDPRTRQSVPKYMVVPDDQLLPIYKERKRAVLQKRVRDSAEAVTRSEEQLRIDEANRKSMGMAVDAIQGGLGLK